MRLQRSTRICCLVLLFSVPTPSAARKQTNAASRSSSVVKKKRSHKRKLQSALHESRALFSKQKDESEKYAVPVVVEAILLPRVLPVRGLIRLGCFGFISLSLLQCVATAGIPHIQTIWGLLHGTDIPMPIDYMPNMADIQLSQVIASSTNELLPPISLPSVGPLLRLFASILLFLVTTILIPQWSTSARVLLDYRKIPTTSSTTTTNRTTPSDKKRRLSRLLLLHGTTAPTKSVAVLVKILDRHLQQEIAAGQEERQTSAVICPLHWVVDSEHPSTTISIDHLPPSSLTRMESHFSHPTLHFFELNQCRFYFDVESHRGTCIDGGPLLHSAPIQDLFELFKTGISSTHHQVAHERYSPYNRPTLVTPTIAEAFTARLSSPLIVIQLVGRVLSCLEDGLQALLGLVFAAAEHLLNARQAIIGARQMANEVKDNVQDTSSLEVHVLTTNKSGDRTWISKTAGDLIPGDVFVMKQNGNECFTMPVDALLLAGQTLVNEAVLTGESVPQSKIPIDFVERMLQKEQCSHDGDETCLDLDSDRNSILFAGTTLVHCSNTGNQTHVQSVFIPALHEDQGSACVMCMALRTGTYSSKGQLLRTLKSGSHVGAISNPQSEKDSIRLIFSLSLFAVLSSMSLFFPREGMVSSPTATVVPPFRRIIQCTRILIAGIPSDLPLALAAVARSCSQRLRQDSDVICSEPGALLTAAYVDTVVFDKTGTITADTQSVSKLIPTMYDSKAGERDSFQLAMLAGCHSLLHLDANSTSENGSQVVGDPLDLASFDSSGWKYNRTTECYESQELQNATLSEPMRIWQLKCFPFDPSKRLSTAVVVLETAGGSWRMLSLTKGSPDTLRGMYAFQEEADFASRFNRQVEEFEVQGFRSIALGWKDLSGTESCKTIFPNGISREEISAARQRASSLHRNDVEVDDLQFGGFVQFAASIRPSSRRIIEELSAGGLRSIMLTGDAVDAAVTVACKVGLIKRKQVAILEEKCDGSKSLQWRIVKIRRGKKDRGTNVSPSSEIMPFSSSSLEDFLTKEELGKHSLATTGNVLQTFFEKNDIDVDERNFIDNLARVSVIARATPKQKKLVISHLKQHCERKVMMCGDGVNDVAAMKAADVAVSFLNGFGDEKSMADGIDFDDERRRKKIQSQLLGSQRTKKNSERNIKSKENRERLNQEIQKAQGDIRARAAARIGVDPDSEDVTFDIEDVKALMSASLGVMKQERKRQESLRRGGGDAARILVEERRGENGPIESETPLIKPGEASLVAPFSCLHPSIDGVDAVLRASIATAASALATQELISLHSLMSCANMASLYREGVRYGKNMMMVENMFYMLVDQQRYQQSRIPRPKLPASPLIRPPISMFHPSTILRTFVQAALNLVTMNVAVRYAKTLEPKKSTEALLQLRLVAERPRKISQILTAIASSTSKDPRDGESRTASLFRQPPFHPNYETNMIFIFSVLQNMLVSLSNHHGHPFYRGVLESEVFSSFALGVIGFCVTCVAEVSPKLNSVLQLRSLPDRKSRSIILALVVFNTVTSLGINRFFLGEKIPHDRRSTSSPDRTLAADLEEQLLKEELDRNFRRCLIGLGLIVYLASSAIL